VRLTAPPRSTTRSLLRRAASRVPGFESFGHESPPYTSGSVVVNRMGLQVARTLWGELSWRLRRAPSVPPALAEQAEAIERDGVLVLPGFLDATACAAVRREFDALSAGLELTAFRGAADGRLLTAQCEVTEESAPETCRHLRDNPVVPALASVVTRRRITRPPRLHVTVYRCGDRTAPDNDIENILHADLHLSTAKMWYAVDDVDAENGAFVYAKGSHRLNLARLRHEYEMSIRTARLKRGDSDIPSHLVATRAAVTRNVIGGGALAAMGVHETTMVAPANALIVANNRGFHRRGLFTSERPRRLLLLNFRHLERGW
jgi:hypothetical protein